MLLTPVKDIPIIDHVL